MFARQGPKVRSACEECHGRKTKCVIGRDGGACNACKSNSRDCYFKPRFKSGRPYSGSSSSREQNNTSTTNHTIFDTNDDTFFTAPTESSNHQEAFRSDWTNNTFGPILPENENLPGPEQNGSTPSGGTNTPDFVFGAMNPQYAQSIDSFAPLNTIFSERASPLHSPTVRFNQVFDLNTPTTGGHGTSLSSNSTEKSGSYDSSGSLTRSLVGDGAYAGSNVEAQQGDTLTLSHCVELHRDLETAREALSEPNQPVPHETVLQAASATISRSCKRLSALVRKGPYRTSPLTLNTAVLAIFMVGKALELSSLFAQSKVQTPCPLDYALFLKRLECSVMELQISSPHIEQHQPVLSAAVDKCMEESATILNRLHQITTDNRRR